MEYFTYNKIIELIKTTLFTLGVESYSIMERAGFQNQGDLDSSHCSAPVLYDLCQVATSWSLCLPSYEMGIRPASQRWFDD